MDFREILVQPEYSKLSSFNTQLEGFEKLFRDKDLLGHPRRFNQN